LTDRANWFFARAQGRNNFQKVQLIHNGKVVEEANSRKVGGHFSAVINRTLKVDAAGWVALRVDSGFATLPVSAPPVTLKGQGVNEFGQGLFAHASPIYIEHQGQRMFQPATARALIREMEAAIDEILKRSQFAGDSQKMEVLRVYEQGILALEKRLAAHSK
jgi:hypothetical protein